MILSLALRYQKHIALFLLSISFVQLTIAERIGRRYQPYQWGRLYTRYSNITSLGNDRMPVEQSTTKEQHTPVIKLDKQVANRPFIGGPTQPESQSFSSVNSNNMVDLFSGDFSYNIPLLDVGGYPVNIAYHSGVNMDEEASWVGLGWNINPGTITRNMRGVPDDFNGGADTIKKITSVKPNKSFGVTLGGDVEIFGLSKIKGANGEQLKNSAGGDSAVKFPAGTIGASYGIFHNTYKGWGFERGLNASLNVGSKSFGSLSGGLSLTNNSQEGVSIAPSLSASLKREYDGGEKGWDVGVSIAAPYNSRAGLRGMQLGLNGGHWAKKKGETPKQDKSMGNGSGSFGSYSFAWPTTVPAVTMPMTNFNQSFTLKVGGEIKGVHMTGYISGYFGREYIAAEDMTLAMPVFGYLNYQNMVGNRDALTDFNREKELFYREKPAVPHIGVPAYTYDVFSISGEGTGGSFRPYRSDIGFIADHRMRSKTSTDAVSLDIGLGDAVHGGVDLNRNYSYTQNGPWEAENTLGNTINFRKNDKLYEAVYFRNPAEKAINTTDFYNAIGGDDVVTPALTQLRSNSPTIIASNTLSRYSEKKKVGSIDLTTDNVVKANRDKRTQVITYHTAAEAATSGLDKYIYHHEINKFAPRHCDDISVGDTVGVGTGWLGYFYKNTEFAGEAFRGVQSGQSVYYDWERWTPFWLDKDGYPRIKIDRNFVNDNFTVRWLGRLKAPVTGTYDLGIVVDDRCRVWMNDTLLFDNWTPKKGSSWMTRKVNLVKDKFYNIRVDYVELGGNGFAYVKMGWRRPDEQNKKWDRENIIQIDKKYMYAPSVLDTATVDEVITKENRINNFRKSSHISEIDVLNADGRRYVYGIPVYNILQKEVSFSVDKDNSRISDQTGMTTFSPNENSTGNNKGQNGFYSRQEIPAYAHSFLLTGILSPDYVDMTGNGISDDDLGDAVKFNYSKTAGIASPFEWRAPYSDSANYSEGLKTYSRDDKAHFISGKKEMWYMHSIESKTMIATFTLGDREDLLEINEGGGKMKRGKARCLKQIDLYSKADFLKDQNPRPIKTVHFEYSYELCRGVNSQYNDSGKLTLKKIWFTYNGNEKGKLNPYEFYYHNNNPRYQNNSVDKWGTYKHPSQNPGAATEAISNADYPYALQDSTLAARNAAAWTMDSIKLPSGGRIKVKYESDDYAYVQNRRATQMMELAGFGSSSSSGINNDRLYSLADLALGNTDYKYVFVKVPVGVTNKAELYARYLDGIKKLYFRLYVQMPLDKWGSGSEYVPVYATPDTASKNWYGVTNDANIIWVKIDGVNGDGDGSGSLSPLAQAAINYLRLNLPSKAYPDSEPGDDFNPLVAVKTLVPSLGEMSNMLLGFNKMARIKNVAAHTKLFRSYIRLNCPSLKKLGGGLRVKTVLVYDHWNKMTNQREAVYGQTYDYTTTQTVNGKEVRISSGVAAWEPVMGAEENPFHLPIEYQNQISVMAPAASQYSEEPLGEAFFPGASIGYSRVRTRSINTNKTRSANGFAETRYYTTYDFPTTWDWSMIDNDNKKRYKPVLRNFLRIDSKSYLSLSQGFKVELNDMNGKLRSEASYSETNAVTPVTSTEYFYKVDHKTQTHQHLNNVVTTIDPLGNIDTAATIGKDVELMADMRDQTSVSQGANINVNTDFFTIGGFPAIIPALLNLFQKETNRFRSAAMTKIIYRYGIVDSIVSIDKGSRVSAINLLYDAETGDPLLTSSQNEFNDRVYQFTYPAHWTYKGIAPAYQNIGAILEHLSVRNGKITNGTNGQDSLYLTAGDELLVYSKQTTKPSECGIDSFATFPDTYKLWVIDSNSVRGGEQKLFLVGKDGTPFSGNDVTVKVIRSGHRNINGAVGSIASLRNPMILGGDGKYKLQFDTATKVINAGASEMAQFWKVADKRVTDLTQDCIPTSADSARFANEACSCMKPFFDYLINYQKLYPANFMERKKTVSQVVSAANQAGYNINIDNCPILKDNLNKLFRPMTGGPNDPEYRCMIGDAVITLIRPASSMASFYEMTASACTPQGVVYKKPGVEIPKPDTVTIRISPDFTASLLSTQNCPTFRDSLTLVDSASDRLLVETNLDLGGYSRNAISVLRFNGVSQIPANNADILSAKLILQADQRGHYGTMYPNANSVNPVDTLSVSLATPGWFKGVPIETYHNLAVNSPWHKEVRRVVPFQNDTIDVKDYIEGYRNRTYGTRTFMLTQGSKDFHLVNDSVYGVFVEPPPYLQSGYSNYYSTYYSQHYANPSKRPVIEVTYVVLPPMPDTLGAVLTYNSTIQCSDINSPSCYSAVTDKMVNPYQYGILGNFRPLRSYVYYGRRVESDPMQPINTRTNGVIKDFAPFWILADKRWVPTYDTTRWVWNAQTTLFNRKGFELENKDPLGRYNAGIYGYGLTLPTAVLQNSHFQEGAYEGFEDYDFEINNCDNACPVARSFDWSAHKADFTTAQAHTGMYSLRVNEDGLTSISANLLPAADGDIAQLTAEITAGSCGAQLKGMKAARNNILPNFAPIPGTKVIVGGWVKEDNSCQCKGYTRNHIIVSFTVGGNVTTQQLSPSGNLVEGWQRYEAEVDIPANATQMTLTLQASDSATTYFDDIRIHPYHAQMKSFAYNAVNLRLMAELDENNYATLYEYDDDGTLVRVKKETERGVQTIKESRSALLKEQ